MMPGHFRTLAIFFDPPGSVSGVAETSGNANQLIGFLILNNLRLKGFQKILTVMEGGKKPGHLTHV